jgi:hypothetical protein
MPGRRYGRSTPARARWLQLKYPGTCRAGEHSMAAGETGWWSPAERAVLTCTDLDHAERVGLTTEVWTGAPSSGQWTRTLTSARLGGVTVPAEAVFSSLPSSSTYARFDRRGGYGRCEDAPCCGCCD